MNWFKKIVAIGCFVLLAPLSALGFSLSVTCSGGDGEWVDGVYQVDPGATINFSVSATGGTEPYSYSWDFNHPPKGTAINWRRDWDTDNDGNIGYDEGDDHWLEYSTIQKTSYQFLYVADYTVTVHVRDSTGLVEKAILLVSAPKIKNPSGYDIYCATSSTNDCSNTRCDSWSGTVGLSGDGSTDNSTTLKDWMVTLGDTDKVVIVFPDGSYRFVGSISAPNLNWKGISFSTTDGVVFQGDTPSGATLKLDLPYDANGSTCEDGDGACDTYEDYFFINNMSDHSHILTFKNLNLYRDLNGYTTGDLSSTTISYCAKGSGRGTTSLQNCTVKNFDVVGTSAITYHIMYRNNALDWGNHNGAFDSPSPGSASNFMHGSGCAHGSCTTGFANSLIWQNYISTSTRASHVFYMGEGEDYQYMVENFANGGPSGIDKQKCFSYFTTTGTIYDQSYKWALGNNCFNIGDDGIYNRADENPHDLYWYDNTFKNIGGTGATIVNTYDNSNANIEVKYNLFDTIRGASVVKVSEKLAQNISDLNVSYNIFGIGADGNTAKNLWEFVSLDVISCKGGGEDLPNQVSCNPPLTAVGNIDSNQVTNIIDPGQWEYNPPLISSVIASGKTVILSAKDSGSGLNNNLRFPYKEGGFIQVTDVNMNFSEIKKYNETTSWGITPYYVRIADVDHNISKLVQINEMQQTPQEPAPPKNLRIISDN